MSCEESCNLAGSDAGTLNGHKVDALLLRPYAKGPANRSRLYAVSGFERKG